MHHILRHLIAAAALSIAACASADNLVLLHTNDTHSQIDPDSDGLGGVARRKALIDSVRAANKHVLVIDLGDIVQGTLFFNIYNGEVEEKVMNLLGYDVRILGNHEFDNGMQPLADNLSHADALLLCSNYQTLGTPLEGIFETFAIRYVDGRRIGFVPVNLNPTGMISPRNTEGLGYVDGIEAANHLAWILKHIYQTDMVIALTHIGYDAAPPCDSQLIAASTDIDLVIGGHTHDYIDPANPKSKPALINNADGRPIPVAQSGRGGRYVGEITINLDNLGDITTRLIPVDSRLDDRLDPAVEQMLQPYRNTIDSINSNIVAKAPKELEKGGPAMLNYISDYVAQRGRQLYPDVDFAIVNKGSMRNAIPAGPVSEGQIITLIPFYNRIQVLEISGAELLDAFDVMAKAGGNGVSSEIDAVYDPDTDRCVSVKLNGKDLDAAATYHIATIDYLAQGGDYMTPLTHSTLMAESDVYLYQDLLNHLRSSKPKAMKTTDTIRMRPNK